MRHEGNREFQSHRIPRTTIRIEGAKPPETWYGTGHAWKSGYRAISLPGKRSTHVKENSDLQELYADCFAINRR